MWQTFNNVWYLLKRKLRSELIYILVGNVALVGLVALRAEGVANPLAMLRLILGLAYVLYIPGYLLQKLLFPAAIDLDRVERIAISFALSGAVVPPIALLLNWLPWGISLWPIIISLSGFILLCTMGIIIRQVVVPAAYDGGPPRKLDVRAWWAGLEKPIRWAYIIFIAILLTASLTSISILAMPKPAEYFTEFYILGKDGLAEDYPREVTAGQVVEVTTGITNREGVNATYGIVVKLGSQVIGQTGSITLNYQSTWEQPVAFSVPDTGNDQQITFILDMEGQQSPYRTLRLWVNVIPAQ